jgi:hypothetical protein
MNSILQEGFVYKIKRGNERGEFDLSERNGVWSIEFKRRLLKTANYKLQVTVAKADRPSTPQLTIHLTIIVTP